MNPDLFLQHIGCYVEENILKKIVVYDSLASTNITAKEMAANGCEHGTVVIANQQTAGIGRRGRRFYSPPGSGLYMSMVLRMADIHNFNIMMLTPAVAVVVYNAIKTVTNREPGIKWVNDILLDGKKICGILVEAVTDAQSDGVGWVVAGIGINIDTVDFPTELQSIAGSIFQYPSTENIRSILAAEIINNLLSSEYWASEATIYKEYKNKMVLLNKKVTVTSGNDLYNANVIDLDENCGLVVQKPDGTIITLQSGEVMVR